MANLSDFKVNDVLLTYGADMYCHKCVCKTKITEINERGIVTKSDGCDYSSITTWDNMKYAKDYFLYSVEQEKAMQEQCDKEYNEWRDACDRELEEARKYCEERREKTKKIIKEKGRLCGTHFVVDLNGKSSFFRWKKYAIYSIDDDLDMFGIAEDGDTMILNIDEVAVPIKWEVEKEVDKLIA